MFNLGQTNASSWATELPGPWSEIEIPGRLTVTYPSENLQGFDAVKQVAEIYEQAIQRLEKLMGTGKMYFHERLTFDIQFSEGTVSFHFNIEVTQ